MTRKNLSTRSVATTSPALRKKIARYTEHDVFDLDLPPAQEKLEAWRAELPGDVDVLLIDLYKANPTFRATETAAKLLDRLMEIEPELYDSLIEYGSD